MNALFTSPLGGHLVFKEAKSLSKAYGFKDFLRLIATSAEHSAFAGDRPGSAKQTMIA